MPIFNSYVKLPEGTSLRRRVPTVLFFWNRWLVDRWDFVAKVANRMLTIKFESEKDPSRPSRASDILLWSLVICFSATRNPRNPRFSPGFLWTTMLPDSLVTFSLAPRRISPTTPGAAQEKLPLVHSTLHRGGSSDVSTGRSQQQRRGGLLLLSDDGYWVKHGPQSYDSLSAIHYARGWRQRNTERWIP